MVNNLMCELADEELAGVIPKQVTVQNDTWQDVGYYTDEHGCKRWGVIPKKNNIEVNFNNKNGYVGINKLDNGEYFCEIVYNYSKIEFYADLDDLPIILANSLIIQNSISYNDTLIALELESNAHDERELKYELKKPKESESTFSDYLQEYVAEESEDVELPDDN